MGQEVRDEGETRNQEVKIEVTRHDPRAHGRRKFRIWTKEQADAEGVAYQDWREVSTPGEYGLTDDGYVTELISFWSGTSKRGHKSVCKTFSLGRFWQNHNARKQKFLYSERKAAFARWESHPDAWVRREAGKTRTKNAVLAYVQYMMQGKAPDWSFIGQIYRPDQKKPAWTAKRLFKQDRIKDMVNAELARIMTSKGATPEFVVEKVMSVVKKAEEAEDLTNMRLQLRDLAEMLEMFPKAQKGDPFGSLPEADAVDTLTEADMERERQLYISKTQQLTTHSGNGTPPEREEDGV